MSPSDASALDPWDNLPPHLQEALRQAMKGLSEAFLDTSHPFSPALQALWDVTDQIEAYVLERERNNPLPASVLPTDCNPDTQPTKGG